MSIDATEEALIAPFWRAAQDRRLVIQSCLDCGAVRFPPTHLCPACLSTNQGWREASGRGTLETWCEFHRAYWEAWRPKLPYTVCLVQLEEGPLLISNLVGDLPPLARGLPLEVVFEQEGPRLLPRFRAAENGPDH